MSAKDLFAISSVCPEFPEPVFDLPPPALSVRTIQRVVRDIARVHDPEARMKEDAFWLVHQAAEEHLELLFRVANWSAHARDRLTLYPADLQWANAVLNDAIGYSRIVDNEMGAWAEEKVAELFESFPPHPRFIEIHAEGKFHTVFGPIKPGWSAYDCLVGRLIQLRETSRQAHDPAEDAAAVREYLQKAGVQKTDDEVDFFVKVGRTREALALDARREGEDDFTPMNRDLLL